MPSDTELLHCFPPRPKPGDYSYRNIQVQRPASNSNKGIFQHSCTWGFLAWTVHHPELGVLGYIKEQSLDNVKQEVTRQGQALESFIQYHPLGGCPLLT